MSEKKEDKQGLFGQVYLTRSDRLVEALCGVIMVLSMVSYLRITLLHDPNVELHKVLVLVPIGANAAWGIIDGIMYVLTRMIDRSRAFKLYSSLRAMDQKEAHKTLEDEFKSTLVSKLNENDRANIYNEILRGVHSLEVKKPQLITKGDLIVVLFTFLIAVFVAFIVVVPFWVLNDVLTAVRFSSIIGIVLLFYLGYRWAKIASKNKIRSGLIIAMMGFLIALVTVVLGG